MSLILLFLSFLLLVFFPESAFQGAKRGLLLWFQVVVPTLFPFLILTGLCVKLKVTDFLAQLFSKPLTRLFRLTPSCAYPVITGALSGYPVGAKAVCDIWKEKKISLEEGSFLLGFCNNVSPMFFLNFVCIQALGREKDRFFLLLLLWTSGILSALFLYPGKTDQKEPRVENQVSACPPSPGLWGIGMDSLIMDTAEILVKVGGYIILFSLLSNIFTTHVPAPVQWKALFSGILEITTGIHTLSLSDSLSASGKLILGMGLCSFGGLSALFQTKSVLGETPFSAKSYLFCKIRAALFCTLLTFLYIKIRGY